MIKDHFSSDLLKPLGFLFYSFCSSSRLFTFKVPTKSWALCRLQPHHGKEITDHPCFFHVPALFPRDRGHPAPSQVTQDSHLTPGPGHPLQQQWPNRPSVSTQEYFPCEKNRGRDWEGHTAQPLPWGSRHWDRHRARANSNTSWPGPGH